MPQRCRLRAADTVTDDLRYREQVGYLFARSRFYRDKLMQAGFPDPTSVGGLERIAALPLTEKDELRASRMRTPIRSGRISPPTLSEVVRIYSTSGTTGTPSYIPLTAVRP